MMTEQKSDDAGVEAEALLPGEGDPDGGGSFEPRQLLLLAALAEEANVQAAAKAAGVTRQTAHRWLRMPEFHDELARRREVVLAEALAGVTAHATRAAAELGKLLDEKDGRLRRLVCNDILERAMRAREVEEFGRRLAAVEKMLENSKGGMKS